MSQESRPAGTGEKRPAGQGKPSFEKKKGKNRKPLYLILAIIAAAAIFAGTFLLGQFARDASTTEVSPSPSGQVNKNATLRVGLVLSPTNLDIRTTSGVALDQALIDNVYQGLVGLTPDARIVPVLASDYAVSDDGLTYTFKVRDNVTFHDGNALALDDVVSSLTQTRDNSSFKGSSELQGVTSIAAVDGAIVLTLNEPNSMLLWSLAGRAGLVYEQASTIDYKNSANGTGPFALDSWKKDDSLTLKRFDGYYGDQAGVKAVQFRYITDPNAAISAALGGDVDVQVALSGSLKGQYKSRTDFTLHEVESTDVFTLAYNNARAPFTDKRVRTAISQAIDQKAILEALDGTGKALGGPITSLDPGYRDLTDVNAYDPKNAKKLLEEAGATDLSLTLTIPNAYELTVANLLVSQLADVGITVKIKQVEFSTWLEDVYTNHDFDLSYVDHAEARDFGNYANPDYYFGYDNPEVVDLYNQSLRALDEKDVDKLLAKAAAIVAKDAPANWLYNFTPITAINQRVHDFPTQSTSSRMSLSGVTVTE